MPVKFAPGDIVKGRGATWGSVVSVDEDGDPKVRYAGAVTAQQKYGRDFNIMERACRRSFDNSSHNQGVMVYCGNFVGQGGYAKGHCGTCNGYCGPTNGCQCMYCFRKQQSLPKNSHGRTVLVSFDNAHMNRERWYCGARVGTGGYHNPCGSCDGRCGPSNGCQCKACFQLDEAQVPLTGGIADFYCDQSSGISSMDDVADIPLTQELMWNKQTLKVCFLNPISASLRGQILTLARDWTKYARIDLDVTSDPKEADIRITTHCDGYSSQVGTNAMTVCDKGAATMKLADHHIKVIPRKVRHEFGHALGLFHEHQLTSSNELLIPYDKERVLKYYKENSDWDAKKVQHNVLSPKKKDGIHALKNGMDQFSVMLYPIKINCLKSGDLAQNFCTSENPELSVEDRIHIMRMYPGRQPPETQCTSSSFECGMCCQRRVDQTNPRFKYSKGGLCLACAWTSTYTFVCRVCSHRQRIPFQLSSEDTWACRGCDEYTQWRPIF